MALLNLVIANSVKQKLDFEDNHILKVVLCVICHDAWVCLSLFCNAVFLPELNCISQICPVLQNVFTRENEKYPPQKSPNNKHWLHPSSGAKPQLDCDQILQQFPKTTKRRFF